MQFRKKHKIARAVTLGLAAAAVAAPTALAGPRGLDNIDPLIADAIRANKAETVGSPDDRPFHRAVPSGESRTQLDPLIADAIRAHHAQSRNSHHRSVLGSVAEQRSGGFEWTDAGVGAGSTLVLVLLGGGTTAFVYRRRRRPSVL
jgi:hypothetical protein